MTEAEIAVTFIAEGGALLLREDQHRADRLHPVLDVGLDDLAKGRADLQEAVARVDAACGTGVGELVVRTDTSEPPPGARARLASREGEWAWLMRDATFREGVAGTAIMWLWEKELAAAELAERGQRLHTRDPHDQFILGSLVYNSGILHSRSTHRAIRDFSTGTYLWERSEANAHRRPRLNLLAPGPLLDEVLEVGTYREQPTSWLAVYHVLQRYGGYVALERFGGAFDPETGVLAATEPPPPPLPTPEPLTANPEPAPEPSGCATVPASPGWLLPLLSLVLRRPVPHERASR